MRSAKALLLLQVLVTTACGDDGDGAGGAGGSETTTNGSSSSGSTGTAGNGSGGAGGSAPAGCSPYDMPSTCEDGTRCIVVDDAAGLDGGTACAAPGDGPAYSVCTDDADCEDGTLCDRVMKTCKPVCETNADCPGEGTCFPAQTSGGGVIPGLKLCLAGCDPVSNLPCDPTGGAVNCIHRESRMAFDCAPAGDGVENQACDDSLECGSDLGCLQVGDAGGSTGCLHWCVYDGGTDMCSPEELPGAILSICLPQSPSISVDGVVYGGCVKIM